MKVDQGRRRGFSGPVFQRLCLAGALAMLSLLATATHAASDRALSVYAGGYDYDNSGSVAEAGVEFRLPMSRPRFQWVMGLTATQDEAIWAYGGARYTWELSPRWTLNPGFAISLWDGGDGKDLGGTVEFRSSLEISFQLSGRARLGAAIYHLSNAGIYERNPGSNSLVLLWTVPFSD